MVYWDDEKSLTGSKPVELHAFTTDTESWYYVDGLSNVAYGGNTYFSAHIHGDKIEAGSSAIRNRTEVHCDWELAFAWQYVQAPPDGTVNYVRTRLQGSNGIVLFRGTVLEVVFEQKNRQGDRDAIIRIDPFTGDLQTGGLPFRYERRCGVPLYGDLCGVDPEGSGIDVIETGNLTGVSGLTLTAAEFGDRASGFFKGGKIEVNGRRRKIRSHSGTAIVVASTIPGVETGQAFTAYAGCDRLHTTCDIKFDNLPNCKAHPNIPTEIDNPLNSTGMVI